MWQQRNREQISKPSSPSLHVMCVCLQNKTGALWEITQSDSMTSRTIAKSDSTNPDHNKIRTTVYRWISIWRLLNLLYSADVQHMIKQQRQKRRISCLYFAGASHGHRCAVYNETMRTKGAKVVYTLQMRQKIADVQHPMNLLHSLHPMKPLFKTGAWVV